MGSNRVSNRLRKSILLYSVMSGVLLAVVVALISMIPLYRTMRVQREEKLFTVLHTRAAGVEIFLWEAREVARQMASRTLIRMNLARYDSDTSKADVVSSEIEKSIEEAVRFSPNVVAAYCFGSDGAILGQVGAALPDIISKWLHENVAQSETFRVFDVDGYHLLYRVEILDRNDKSLGTLALLYSLDTLRHRLTRLPEAKLSEDTFLGTAENGDVRVFLDMRGQSKISLETQTPPQVLDALHRAMADQTGLFEDTEESSEPYLTVYCPIAGTSWGIAIRLSEEALLADIHEQIISIGFYIFLFILLIGIGMFLMLRPLAGKLVIHSQELEDRVDAQTADLETERKRLLLLSTELRAANEDLDAFSRTVAHDLRAPLVTVQGFSQLLLASESLREDEEGRGMLQRIIKKANFMANLIKALLWYARAGKAELRLQSVNLSQAAEEVARELREEYPQHPVQLIIHPQVTVTADHSLLYVIMVNLLGNAWKYTSQTNDPKVEMGAEMREGEQVCFVRDNGTGFDMMFADKLFEPFQRLHTEAEFAGTGIGLSTVKRIILQHGGRIWAESRIGKGATFYFTLTKPPTRS